MSRPFSLSRCVLGAAAGLSIAYTAVRGYEAWRDLQAPAAARTRDAKRYGDARRLLMLVDIARSVAGIGFWAFAVSDRFERGLAGVPRPLRLPLAAAAMTLVDAVREWPVDYVEGYMLERIYGNSERSGASWAGDRLKGTALGLGVTVVLTFAVDALVHRAPRRWPWLAIGATPPLLVFANLVVPTYVMPLFNKFIPLEGPLEAKIRTLATRYGVGGATILRFDMSRQTKKANAFVTGVFGTERIAIADTLLDEFAEDETLFVVAHELGHYVRRDPWYAVALGTALTGVALLTSTAIVRRTTRRDEGVSALLRLAFYMALAQFAAMPFANGFSRAIERRADRFAVRATDDPASGVRAFRRLRDQNLAEDEGPPWSELIFSSHPSLKSRIEALETIASR